MFNAFSTRALLVIRTPQNRRRGEEENVNLVAHYTESQLAKYQRPTLNTQTKINAPGVFQSRFVSGPP